MAKAVPLTRGMASDCATGARRRLLPARFDDGLEAKFIAEYREAALAPASYAALAAALVFLAFLLVALLGERSSAFGLGATIRFVLIVVLLLTAVTIRFAGEFARENYVWITGAASLVALGGTVLLLSVGPDGTPHGITGASPAVVFGLFLHYAFLRLPVLVAAIIGGTVSVANVVWAAPMVVGGSADIRALLYLLFANVAGVVVCAALESRERELFIQRRRAEAAQAELKERARAAEEAHMEKTRLLAAVSHDLRQPMMAARAYLGTLSGRLRRGDTVQAQRQAALLGQSIDLLGATLDHLLTAARYDSGTEPIRIESVELGPILQRLRETFSAEAAARGIELRIRIPERRLVVVTDATAVWRVLMNLVSNGIKFTQGNGTPGRGVLVKVRLAGGTCRIDVVDTGIGIEKRHLEDIWHPYFQVANSERNRERGLGLGLFLVHRALGHLPQHSLELDSRPGRGSRFTLRLPGLWFNQPKMSMGDGVALRDEDLEVLVGGYVLLLEDDRDARHALEALLSEWGIVYSSGATLQELIANSDDAGRSVDALITDYRLPEGMTGLDCIAALRERYEACIPAILVTGESDLLSVERRLPTSTKLLQKPFDATALAVPLLDAIREARRVEGL